MTAFSVGLLILRVVLGLTMAAHGYNKFFGSGGIAGTAGWFDSIGMRPGALHARLAATTEIAAGLLLAVGLFTPLAAAAFVALMLVAAWTGCCSITPPCSPTCAAGGAWPSHSAWA